jgi:hypothetical protein
MELNDTCNLCNNKINDSKNKLFIKSSCCNSNIHAECNDLVKHRLTNCVLCAKKYEYNSSNELILLREIHNHFSSVDDERNYGNHEQQVKYYVNQINYIYAMDNKLK